LLSIDQWKVKDVQYVCEIASRFFVLSFSSVVLSLTFGDVWKHRTTVKVDEKDHGQFAYCILCLWSP